MQLYLKDGRKVELAGRIDRIDLAFEGEKVYVKIIDYKTGSTTFDYTRLYYGLLRKNGFGIFRNFTADCPRRSRKNRAQDVWNAAYRFVSPDRCSRE